jgi:hypothetical protein
MVIPYFREESMENQLYKKTHKGEEEIKARGAKLPQKLRTMLILIDGSKTRTQLNGIAKQLGIGDDYLKQLEEQGLIVGDVHGTAAQAAASVAPQDEFERFRQAQRFMNQTAVNALGMRSFFFTLKLEKCSTRSELADLLDDYAKALAKGAGAGEAEVLTEQARQLLS